MQQVFKPARALGVVAGEDFFGKCGYHVEGRQNVFMNLPQHLLHRVVSFLLKARISTKPDCPSPCSTGKHDFMDGVDESLLAPVRRDTDDASIIYHLNHPREDDVLFGICTNMLKNTFGVVGTFTR